MRRRLLLATLSSAAALSACGFHLRGFQPGQEQAARYAFRTVFCSVPAYSPLGIELRRQLQIGKELEYLSPPASPKDAEVVLDVYSERRYKSVVGTSATGQTREFQLRLSLKFRLRTSEGRELIPETEISQHRTMSYDEALALAKEAEEAQLYRDMQLNLVQQIARRLTAVKSL